ncbi:ABC transporter permease [Microbacterium invictum]|uniref:Ribose transport system permease protein n=1 Tax=Microbacterium invictum TaxID=515415 RepID=A0AA40SS74_9MICO|nr:ABC transporter permease [Microbacterium invictum]MBB4141279.1 ribose transport system permease protein [Microbacterium invictum]
MIVARGSTALRLALRFGMVWVLILTVIFARIIYPQFFDAANLNNMVAQVAPTAIVAVGMTYAIISGVFDLSVGAVFAASAVLFTSLSNSMPWPLAFACTVLMGIVCGAVNGFVVTYLKVNSFIATLATASLISGGAYLYSNAQPVISSADGFEFLGTSRLGGVWTSTWLLVLLILLLGVILGRTSYGRSIYAVGGNLEASRLAGLRVKGVRISAFMIVAACAAVGGMIVASQTSVGQANLGASVTLDAIAIVIIGGTSLLGGEGAMWRTAIGILLWGTIANVFSALALNTSSQLLIQGGILLIAVSIDSLARRGR